MSWAPGRDEILVMLDRHDLEIVIASPDLATALLSQSDEALATATDAADAGRWYSAYANLWDVEHAADAQFRGAMGALLRPVPRMRSTRNDAEYPDPDTQLEPDFVLADLAKARDIVAACHQVMPHLTVFQR